MEGSLRASTQGLEILNQARIHMGWNRQASVWSQTALTSVPTLKRFLQGKRIQKETFIRICQAVGLDWQKVVDKTTVPTPPLSPPLPNVDWGDAPNATIFYGRKEELTTLEQWIVKDNCHLVALLGMGGIGKTALCVKLAEQIQDKFEYVIWRSLRHAPSLNALLSQLSPFVPSQHSSNPGRGGEGESFLEDTDASISQLMEYFRKHRCLVILDNIKEILRGGEFAGHYREGYEDYGELLQRVGEESHQSCLVLLGREKPREIALLEGETLPVRALQLTGLKEVDAREILKSKGLSGEEEWETLIKLYRGNPLALKLISTTIKDLFNGSVSQFIQYSTLVISDLCNILDQQFERLSNLEKEVMCCLAIERNPVSIAKLREDISTPLLQSEVMEILESLLRRSLIEKNNNKDVDESEVLFTLQPVVIKYVTKYQLPLNLSP